MSRSPEETIYEYYECKILPIYKDGMDLDGVVDAVVDRQEQLGADMYKVFENIVDDVANYAITNTEIFSLVLLLAYIKKKYEFKIVDGFSDSAYEDDDVTCYTLRSNTWPFLITIEYNNGDVYTIKDGMGIEEDAEEVAECIMDTYA